MRYARRAIFGHKGGLMPTEQQPPSPAADMVHIATVTAAGVVVQYATLPGNTPNANGNTLFLWQTTSPAIPWNVRPYGEGRIQSSPPQDSFFLPGNITQ